MGIKQTKQHREDALRVLKREFKRATAVLDKVEAVFGAAGITCGDDVDLLFLGTSPEKPSCLWRPSPRRNKSPTVASVSAAASEGGTGSSLPLSYSAGRSVSWLWGWRTSKGSPLRPPYWRGKNKPELRSRRSPKTDGPRERKVHCNEDSTIPDVRPFKISKLSVLTTICKHIFKF